MVHGWCARLLAVIVVLHDSSHAVDIVSHAGAVSKDGGPVNASMDSSACTANCLLVVCYSASTAGLPGNPIKDSMNNSWVEVGAPGSTKQRETDDVIVWMWVANTPGGPKVGPNHVITATGYGPSVVGMAFSGIASGPDQTNKSTHPLPPLGVTLATTNAKELIVPCMSFANTNVTLAAPFQTIANLVGHGPNSAPGTGVAAGWYVADSAGPVTSSWNYTKNLLRQTIVVFVSDAVSVLLCYIDDRCRYSYIAAAAASWYSTDDPAPLNITTVSLPEAFVGAPYTHSELLISSGGTRNTGVQLTVTGGVEPYTWVANGELPAGLTLSPGGLISGTPTSAVHQSKISFTVTDHHQKTAKSGTMAITVASSPLQITTTSCPGGVQYKQYAGCNLAATGGTPPYTWSYVGGADGPSSGHCALVEGLEIEAATGKITSPKMIGGQGCYTPLLVVTDSQHATNSTASVTFCIDGDNTIPTGCEFFPLDSIFHTKVTDLPVDVSPAAPMDKPYLAATIRPFFGADRNYENPNGIPWLKVPHDEPMQTVSTTLYQHDFTEGPFPPYAPPEGSANAGYGQNGGDRHTLVLQTAGGGQPCKLWEMWQGRLHDPDSNTTWTDSSNALWPDVSSNKLRPNGDGSTDACGLPVAPLTVNYDETCGPGPSDGSCKPGGVIRHPIRFTLNHMLANWVWPARAMAGVGSCKFTNGSSARGVQLPMGKSELASCSMTGPCGQIYRLKAGTATPSGCTGECAVIVQCFRDYGIILADNGMSGGLIGTPDARWNDTRLAVLKEIKLSEFEPVDVSSLVVDNDSGQAKPKTAS